MVIVCGLLILLNLLLLLLLLLFRSLLYLFLLNPGLSHLKLLTQRLKGSLTTQPLGSQGKMLLLKSLSLP